MKMNFFGVVGICWVVACVVLAMKDVGALYCSEPYIVDGSIVPMIAAVTGLPFVAGFLAGREGG